MNGYCFKVEGPLFIPPPNGTMKACGFFDAIETVVRGYGGNFGELIERHGIDHASISDPDYAIRCTTAAALLDYCSNAFDDRLFGLRLGNCLDADVYGAISTYARMASDVRQGIGVLLDYIPLLYSPGAEIEFVTTHETAEFRWHPSAEFDCDAQANYYGQSQILRFLRSLIGPSFRPTRIDVVSDLWRKDVGAMERFFEARMYGNSRANIVSFPARLLDTRLKTSNAMLFGLLGSYFTQVKQATLRTLVDAVRAYIRTNYFSHNCTIEHCARKLEVSARTIQRRLVEQRLKFSELVEGERVEAAKRALSQTGDALSDIALNLGYSDQSSFGRAFKRWTTMTPQAFRDSRERPPTVQ